MAILFQDSFTDTPGVRLNAHTPDVDASGAGWTEDVGTWEITDNDRAWAVGASPGGPGWVATFEGGVSDGTFETIFAESATNTSTQGPIFRYQDPDNFWIMLCRNINEPMVRLFKRVAGTYIDTGVTGFNVTPTSTFRLRVVLAGDLIEVYDDSTAGGGALKMSHNDTFLQTATRYGGRYGTVQNGRMEDFLFQGEASATTITITNPTEKQIFQRATATTVDIPIAGTYAGSPAQIEASFNGGAYATIDAAPAGGVFSGVLSGQTVGNGLLSVRASNDIAASDTITDVRVGDVFLVAGQSNAVGGADNPQVYSGALPCSMYREDNTWADLADPTDSDVLTGSAWPLLANEIEASQNVSVGFVTTAEGATGLLSPDADWSKGGANYNNAVAQIASSGVNGLAGILWAQGERDSFNGKTQSEYNAGLDSLISDLRSEGGALSDAILITSQIAQYVTAVPATNNNAIRAAQAEAWDDNALIAPGPVTYEINLSDGGGDGVHFRTDAEMLTLSQRWWVSVDSAAYSGVDRGPIAIGATRQAADRILIEFDVLLDTGSLTTGAWLVTQDGTPRAVISATPASRYVDLTLDASYPLTGVWTVTLGNANDAAGENVPLGLAITLPTGPSIRLPAEPFYGLALPEVAPGGSGAIIGLGELIGQGFAPTVGIPEGSGPTTGLGELIGQGFAPSTGTPGGLGIIQGIGYLEGQGFSIAAGSGDIDAIGLLVGAGIDPTAVKEYQEFLQVAKVIFELKVK